MSGGVDSTVTAALLQEQGYQVHGFFMQLPLESAEQQQEKVQRVADQLGIPLTCIDVRAQFNQLVIETFIASYTKGLTPNPCVHCNRHLKFGLLLDSIQQHDMALMATGHYARVLTDTENPRLLRGIDPYKDQSYFLCRLQTDQLRHLIFPLGTLTKEQTYEKAAALGFDFSGQESQDVCFLTEDLSHFLDSHGVQAQKGKIISHDGHHLGYHEGIWRYTVGQRRGLGLPDATPWYVIGLDAEHNEVIVGKNEHLMHNQLTLHKVQWNTGAPALWNGQVQIRSRHRPAQASVEQLDRDRFQVTFSVPQRAITPGQYAAFYEGDVLVGSGIIDPLNVQL